MKWKRVWIKYRLTMQLWCNIYLNPNDNRMFIELISLWLLILKMCWNFHFELKKMYNIISKVRIVAILIEHSKLTCFMWTKDVRSFLFEKKWRRRQQKIFHKYKFKTNELIHCVSVCVRVVKQINRGFIFFNSTNDRIWRKFMIWNHYAHFQNKLSVMWTAQLFD